MLENDRYLRRREAAAYLREKFGFGSPGTLNKLATVGGGPAYRYLGERTPVYTTADLDAWALSKLSKPVASTSQRREALDRAVAPIPA